ncbi:UNVERIFIED_CONTAM: Meiotic recombination protein dmc1 [Gekko kuhli]
MKSMEDQVVQEEPGYQDDEPYFFCEQKHTENPDLGKEDDVLLTEFLPQNDYGTPIQGGDRVLENAADIKKLKSVGICTIKGIQMTTRRALCNVKGLSEAKVEKIKEAANKLIEPGFLTAFEYSEKRKRVFHITTGSQEFE